MFLFSDSLILFGTPAFPRPPGGGADQSLVFHPAAALTSA